MTSAIEQKEPDVSKTVGLMRCLRCRNVLHQSGREPYRFVCSSCGQNFIAVMQLVPVDSSREDHAGRCDGTG